MANVVQGAQFSLLDPQACYDKQNEEGDLVNKIVKVATLLFGLIAWVALKGSWGAALAGAAGLTLYLGSGYAINRIYQYFRDWEYQEAGNALKTDAFRDYLYEKNLNPTIDTILNVYREYKIYAADQVDQSLV